MRCENWMKVEVDKKSCTLGFAEPRADAEWTIS